MYLYIWTIDVELSALFLEKNVDELNVFLASGEVQSVVITLEFAKVYFLYKSMNFD